MKGKGAITLKGDQIHLQSGSRNSEATGTPVKGDRGARKAAGIADGVTKNAAALQTVLRTHRNANGNGSWVPAIDAKMQGTPRVLGDAFFNRTQLGNLLVIFFSFSEAFLTKQSAIQKGKKCFCKTIRTLWDACIAKLRMHRVQASLLTMRRAEKSCF